MATVRERGPKQADLARAAKDAVRQQRKGAAKPATARRGVEKTGTAEARQRAASGGAGAELDSNAQVVDREAGALDGHEAESSGPETQLAAQALDGSELAQQGTGKRGRSGAASSTVTKRRSGATSGRAAATAGDGWDGRGSGKRGKALARNSGASEVDDVAEARHGPAQAVRGDASAGECAVGESAEQRDAQARDGDVTRRGDTVAPRTDLAVEAVARVEEGEAKAEGSGEAPVKRGRGRPKGSKNKNQKIDRRRRTTPVDPETAAWEAALDQTVRRERLPRGQFRIQQIQRAYGQPHHWQIVRFSADPEGAHTHVGFKVKKFLVVRCDAPDAPDHPAHTDPINIGIGEARKYTNLASELPSRRKGRPIRRRSDFAQDFGDDDFYGPGVAVLPPSRTLTHEADEIRLPQPVEVILDADLVSVAAVRGLDVLDPAYRITEKVTDDEYRKQYLNELPGDPDTAELESVKYDDLDLDEDGVDDDDDSLADLDI